MFALDDRRQPPDLLHRHFLNLHFLNLHFLNLHFLNLPRAAACSLSALLLSLTLPSSAAEVSPKGQSLVPGVATEHPLEAGGADLFDLELTAGRHWRILVEQHGIDVQVELKGPQGESLFTIDSPLGREGTESLVLVPAVSGPHRIEVRCEQRGVPDGFYEIRFDELPAATPKDRLRLRAETAMSDAVRLYASHEDGANEQMLAKLREALDTWEHLGNHHRQAQTLLLLGRNFDGLINYRQAVAHYVQALVLWRQLNNLGGVATTLDGLGLAHKNLGNHSRAIGYLEESLALRHHLGEQAQEATTRGLLCLALQRSGKIRAAAACYEVTLTLARTGGDTRLEARVLNNLGGVYSNLGEPAKQLVAFQQALHLRRAMGDEFGEATTLNNLGAFHRRLGETGEALLFYSRALTVFERLENRLWEARVLNNLGFAYLTLGDFERARSYLLRALPLRRAVGDKSGETVTLVNLGRIFSALEEPGKALAFFKKSLDNNLAAGNRRGATNARKLLGEHHFKRHELAAAKNQLELALSSLKEMGQRLDEAEVLELLSRVYLHADAPTVAQELATRALEVHRAVQNPVGELAALTTLAHVGRALGHDRAVRLHLETALGILERIHRRLGDPHQRASFLASQRAIYELQIEFLMELHRSAPSNRHDLEALETSERARSRSLLALLEEAGTGQSSRIQPELHELLRSTERRFAAKTQRRLKTLGRKHTAQEALDVEQEFYTALTALENVHTAMRRRNPREATLRRPPLLDTPEIRALLDENTVLLEFFLGLDRSFLWWVTPTSVTTYELPPRSTIEELAQQVHRQVSTIHQRTVATREALKALGQMLLGPVADRLQNQRLVVVADGALHAVPFAALALPRTHEPVLMRHEVVNLPSASVLASQRHELTTRTGAPKTVAILADPIFDRRDPRIQASSTAETSGAPARRNPGTQGSPLPGFEELGRLPHTRREAEAIAALVPVGQRLLALDDEARRARVVGDELSAYRILHFATHGFIHPRAPELSGLIFSRFDQGGGLLDGFLGLYDVSNLKLSAELVVLSGCHTALGKQIRGEGLVGLSRGFMFAGVPRVVASFWQVRDKASARLMEHFYHSMLVENLPPAAALRTAQLALRRERRWRDPFYWAAFALQGDWR